MLELQMLHDQKVFSVPHLLSVAQWDSFSGGQKMEHWLLANTDNKVSWSTGLLKLGAPLVSVLAGCSGSISVSNLEYHSETRLIST